MNKLQANSCQENILVVDDTTANLDILRRMLSNNGYRVRPATNGHLALQAIKSFKPDLILLDILMPEINGYEVCTRLKADPTTEDIPIIFISALTEVFDKVKAFEMGAIDYIPKPFQQQEVLARVENVLRIQRLSKQLVEKNLQLSEEIEHRKIAQESLQQTQVQLAQYANFIEQKNHQLEQTLEDLKVAQEELQVQNEQLANSWMLIQREQQRYQNLFELAPDGYVVTNTFGVIQEANQATAALLNQQQRFLIGQLLISFIPELERAAFHIKLEELGKCPHPAKQWELNLQPKQGEIFPAAITIGTISDEQGKIYGFRWLIRDIRDRKQMQRLDILHKVALEMVAQGYPLQEILQEVTHQIAQLLPNIYASIVLFDKDGQQSHVFVNPKLSPSFVLAMTPVKIAQKAKSGRETAAFLDKRVIVEDVTIDPLWGEFKQLALAHGLSAYWSEPILSGKDQLLGTFELYFAAAPLPNPGELTIIESLARLISLILERKYLEAEKLKKTQELEEAYSELKRTQARLIQSEKMSSLARMVAGIAHEINNPVSFIHGNIHHTKSYFEDLLKLIELYQQTYLHPTPEIEAFISEIDLNFLREDYAKLLSSMKVGTQRIADIVIALRKFSRLDEQELKCVDIHESIDSTLLILEHRFREEEDCPEIEVIKNYGQLPKLKCYVSQLNQVFLHILNNAIDALQNKSSPRRIMITTEIGDDQCTIVRDKQHTTSCIVIKIADNGHGMSEETKHRIFDPFFTTKPVGQGTGLGLAISHQIVVEKHQGQIRCISEVGQQTEMILELPVKMGNG
jgi:PAS domain S-box-containing protein